MSQKNLQQYWYLDKTEKAVDKKKITVNHCTDHQLIKTNLSVAVIIIIIIMIAVYCGFIECHVRGGVFVTSPSSLTINCFLAHVVQNKSNIFSAWWIQRITPNTCSIETDICTNFQVKSCRFDDMYKYSEE